MSKITIDRALIDRVLEVLTDNRADISRCESAPYMAQYYDKAITALREALAQPQQEPVAWMRPSEEGYDSAFRDHSTVVACKGNKWEGWVPLYTSPPAKTHQEPVGMTFDDAYASLNWADWRMRPVKELLAELHRLTSPPAPVQELAWRPMDTAPRDGTIVRLNVWFEDHSLEDGVNPVPTIGANHYDNNEIDEWQFAGWCWSHDCFTEGIGKPLGWLPMLEAAHGIKDTP